MTAANQKAQNSAGRWITALTAATACAVVAGLAAPAAAAGAPAAPAAAGAAAWQQARQMTSPDGLTISVSGISCSAPGDCTADGTYEAILNYYEPPDYEGFVVDQRAGVWGGIKPIPGLLALNVGGTVTVTAPSCPSPGNCAIGGTYTDGKSDQHAFVVSARNGTWGNAQPIPGLAALAAGGSDTVNEVSCGAPGDCAATGTYYTGVGADPIEPFLATETRGTWGKATEGPSYGTTQIAGDVTCRGPGDCVLFDTSASAAASFVVEEKNGAWGKATLLPGTGSSDVSSLSCTSPGNCLAGGDYLGGSLTSSQAAVWRESDGAWSARQLLPGVAAPTSDGSAVTLVSCASPTSCAAAGWYDNAKGYGVPFASSETDGTWAAPVSLAGLAGIVINSYSVNLTVTSLSCGAPGDCTAGGYYANGGPLRGWAFLADETGGTWSKARRVPGVPTGPGMVVGPSYDVPAIDSVVTDVSCTTGGFCGATGDDVETYNGKAYQASFLVNRALQAPTTTVLRLSASRVTDGREQSEKLTITVTPKYGGTPAGPVTVRAGSATACVITLTKTRTASCTLTAKRLGPGTYHLVARYAASALDAGSASAAKNLTIEK